ncbi:MAG TPA: ethanolamine ammonia-lyase subunit EutB, partial [Vicinamibacterales bacterium]|nr:ethanolamine ammonia-lyase subunit EutB [Vicinamibacterales bacterium]
MDARRLREALVLANAFKEGDLLVGGTRDEALRESARAELLATTLREIDDTPLVDDAVSDALARSIDREAHAAVGSLTLQQFRDTLLSLRGSAWVRQYRGGLTSQSIAAVVKVMTNEQLASVARSVFNPLPGDGIAIGSPRHFGSRIQPNSPGDAEDEILFSVFEGLAYGCGDVVIGVNPASDDLETIVELETLLRQIVSRLDLPTRYCVLSDLRKQHAARARVHVDVGFQSLAGTSKALAGMVGLDVDGVLDLARDFPALYFETGQGSAVTNGAAEGVDMVTLESRTYGVARVLMRETRVWTIVNDVAGFIGPEVFRTPQQLERACLEDSVMAKLHGLTMGLDVCATFHMGIDPAALRSITERVVASAAPAYLMAVAGNADPMLGYLTTSFREHPSLRDATGRQMTSAMQRRLNALGVFDPVGRTTHTDPVPALYAQYHRAGGDERSTAALIEEARRKQQELVERGFDLGRGPGEQARAASDRRVDVIYNHARLALYAALDAGVIRDAAPNHLHVRSTASDRDDYLSHPARGERLRPPDTSAVLQLYSSRRTPQIQLVISDGLNANAVNEHLRAVLQPLRRQLGQAGVRVADIDVVIENGRVRAGYHLGQLIEPDAVVHFIGERPGTGLNTMSAYLTYGRDDSGRSRWRPDLDHSYTTAVCGI